MNMNKKSILMPHACQKVGWCLLILSILTVLTLMVLAKAVSVDNIDVVLNLSKGAYVAFVIAIFLLCLSREKVEDEMISSFRLKSIGIIAYVFFVILLVISAVLWLKPGNPYLSELFLIALPVLLFVLYYGLFKWMIWRSQKQQAV